MIEKIKARQRLMLVSLIILCMGIILAGGFRYISMLRTNLQNQAIENVMTVTKQQRQAFDNFIASDRERLHSLADFFSANDIADPAQVRLHLSMFYEVDALYAVTCIDDGWLCSSSSEEIWQVDEETLADYRSLSGSGVRDVHTGLVTGVPRFGYYECFTFGSTGHKAIVQKSYDRSKMIQTFSLSFYNDQGLAYVVNSRGEILLHSKGMLGDRVYSNIFDVLTGTNAKEEDVDKFMDALHTQETGSMVFSGDRGNFVYTYVPVETVDDWYLVSIVPTHVIAAATDRMLLDSQMALGLLVLLLVLCGIFSLLIWRTHKVIAAKEQEADYHSRLFELFATYIARNTDDVYIMMDHKTEKLEYVSPNVERVMGVDGEHLFDHIRQSESSGDVDTLRAFYTGVRALAPGQTAESRNIERINPKTGERRYFVQNVYCAEIQGRAKRISYISDRTEERKAQNDLAEALRMAQAASEAKTAFLGSVSHDIRTPMNAIIGFLALMKDETDNPAAVTEYIQRIDAASQHLLGLINDVLDMNKIESGSATLSISEMNLAKVIDEISTIIRPQAKAKNQTFDITVSNLSSENLMGDKLRINQVLINLLSNSVKYTPEGGSLRMQVDELPRVVENYSRIRFTVSDNGLGMSEDYLKVIFEPFTREETEVTHQIQGTGLGMAITKSLVDLMGGTIHVESELGKGSTFTVELELCIQKQEEDSDFWKEHKVTRIIVTDDDEDVCKNIVRLMDTAGIATDYATDGETAVRMMRESRESGKPYDLILLDWKMPGLNGLETARLIRKNYSEKIPILLLTAYDWSDIEQEAEEIGVNHFMPKPFFISTFKAAIRRLTDSQKKPAGKDTGVVQGRHILVVDDIEVNRIILVKILGTLGASCDIACNGQEAVEKFESSRPGEYDLILMDVQMPVMDGYTATRTIRAGGHPSAETVPIIAMTANAFADDVREALASGMDAHIAKPVQLDTLKSTIQQVLDSRQGQGS